MFHQLTLENQHTTAKRCVFFVLTWCHKLITEWLDGGRTISFMMAEKRCSTPTESMITVSTCLVSTQSNGLNPTSVPNHNKGLSETGHDIVGKIIRRLSFLQKLLMFLVIHDWMQIRIVEKHVYS